MCNSHYYGISSKTVQAMSGLYVLSVFVRREEFLQLFLAIRENRGCSVRLVILLKCLLHK